jgi:hypothetical protein
MATEKNRPRQVGRKPKADPCRHRLSFNLNDADYQEFLTLFEKSGLSDRARFIASCVFKREWKVVKIDKATMDYASSTRRKVQASPAFQKRLPCKF